MQAGRTVVPPRSTAGGAKGRGYRGNKTIVAGAIQRDGNVRMERIPDGRRTTLHGFIRRTVKDEAEAIYTDEWAAYAGIEDDDTRHETVNHGADEWVVGDVHTNSIEGVWSLFKGSIVGSFHNPCSRSRASRRAYVSPAKSSRSMPAAKSDSRVSNRRSSSPQRSSLS